MSQIDGAPDVAGSEQRETRGAAFWVKGAAASALALLAILAQCYGLYRPGGPPQPWLFPGSDKVLHLIGFAAPVALVLQAGRRPSAVEQLSGSARPSRRFTVTVLALFGVHAVVSELVQGAFYTWRDGDPLDIVADLTGVALGWGVLRLIHRRGSGVRRSQLARP